MKSSYLAICDTKNLAEIRNFAEEFLADAGLKGTMASRLILAIDEACANAIIHHNKRNANKTFKLTLEYRPRMRQLSFSITDTGVPYDINTHDSQGIDAIIDNRKQGGLGIRIIKSVVDDIDLQVNGRKFTYKFIKNL